MAALPRDLGLIPSTHPVAYCRCLYHSSPRGCSTAAFWLPQALRHTRHTGIRAGEHPYTQNKNLKIKRGCMWSKYFEMSVSFPLCLFLPERDFSWSGYVLLFIKAFGESKHFVILVQNVMPGPFVGGSVSSVCSIQ